MGQQSSDFFKEFFKQDESGKPIALFDIEVLVHTPGRSIKRAAHCRLVLPHVQNIDHEISRLLAQDVADNQSLESILASAQQLHAVAGKLTSQAIYLDSADRNGWEQVKMTVTQPGTFSTLGGMAWVLKDFCENIEEEKVASKNLDDAPSL